MQTTVKENIVKRLVIPEPEIISYTNESNIKKSVGILIGKFQPLHNGYYEIIKKGLINEDIFIVCLGSADIINNKNPYYWQTRKLFIYDSIKREFLC